MYLYVALRCVNENNLWMIFVCTYREDKTGKTITRDRVGDAWDQVVFPYLSISLSQTRKNSYRLGISTKGYTSRSCFKIILQNGKVSTKASRL